MIDQGAYLIYLRLKHNLRLNVGSLKNVVLSAGQYVYVGSARRGIAARLARHRRLAKEKVGKPHWHVDYLLLHSHVEWVGHQEFPHRHECQISKLIASRPDVTVPIARFGATDCRFGCRSHLYRLKGKGRMIHYMKSRPARDTVVKAANDSGPIKGKQSRKPPARPEA